MKWLSFLTCCIGLVVLSCSPPDSPEPEELILPQTIHCLEYSKFPKIPYWNHEVMEMPMSYNRGWEPLFLSEKIGYLTGGDGHFLSTKDGGFTWEDQFFGEDVFINDLQFIDGQYGMLSAMIVTRHPKLQSDGALFVTNNGGETWTKHSQKPKGVLREIYFLNRNRGFALFSQLNPSYKECLVQTDDGGLTWDIIDGVRPASSIRNSMNFNNSLFGYFEGADGTVVITEDGGVTWQVIETGLDRVEQAQFLSRQVGYVTDFNGMYKTSNGGLSWEQVAEYPVIWFHFFDIDEGISLQVTHDYFHFDYSEYCQAFRVTKDGAQSWVDSWSGYAVYIQKPDFVHRNLGYSVNGFAPPNFIRLDRR